MSDLMAADAWMHFVLTSSTPLNVCERRFREFNLRQDMFIKDEICGTIIHDLRKRGYMDSVEAYEKILAVLERVIREKQ